MSMSTSNMEVIVGTYDEVILGYRLVNVAEDVQVEASFTDNSHSGCIKCITVSDKGILASGSTDETIRLLNIRKKKEMGSLAHHSGSITSVQFHKGFLFSASEDGKLCLWKNFTWECMRTFKGHKSGINSLSVHPSGKLVLTVGKDRALHTWNLITGRSAFITNIKQVADVVRWSPDGEKYIIVVNNKIDIYSVETAEVSTSIQCESRINCAEFHTNDILCYGGEGGTVYFHNITDNKQLHLCETGTTRIKGLSINKSSEIKDVSTVLTTASSDGLIKFYKIIEKDDSIETEKYLEYNTGFRITCMAVYTPNTSDVLENSVKAKDSASESVRQSKKQSKDRKEIKEETTEDIVSENVKKKKEKVNFEPKVDSESEDESDSEAREVVAVQHVGKQKRKLEKDVKEGKAKKQKVQNVKVKPMQKTATKETIVAEKSKTSPGKKRNKQKKKKTKQLKSL